MVGLGVYAVPKKVSSPMRLASALISPSDMRVDPSAMLSRKAHPGAVFGSIATTAEESPSWEPKVNSAPHTSMPLWKAPRPKE